MSALSSRRKINGGLAILAVLLGQARTAAAQVAVSVVDDSGQPIVSGFRWQLEDDNSYGIKKTDRNGPWAGPAAPGAPSLPGTPSPNANWVPGGANPTHTLSVNIHKSHSPTVCVGDTQTAPSVVIDTTNCPDYSLSRNYILSVLPWHTAPGTTPTGYTMSGRLIAAGQQSVRVVVHPHPQPTAQITAIVFEDNQSINGAYDQPSEHGLSNFTFVIVDPAGPLKQDAFAYPLGTTYQYQCATVAGRPASCGGGCDSAGVCPDSQALNQGEQPQFALDPDTGLPLVVFLG